MINVEPHNYRIYYANIDLRHQYGIFAAETQTFPCQRRRTRRNGCFWFLPLNYAEAWVGTFVTEIFKRASHYLN